MAEVSILDASEICLVEVANTVEIGSQESEEEGNIISVPSIIEQSNLQGHEEIAQTEVVAHDSSVQLYSSGDDVRSADAHSEGHHMYYATAVEEKKKSRKGQKAQTTLGDIVEQQLVSSSRSAAPITTGQSISSVSVQQPKQQPQQQRIPGYQCDLCRRWFSSSIQLTGHNCRATVFQCKDCNKTFYTNAQLKVHIRVHTGQKPYRCDTCGRCFAQSATLIQHIRTHTGERPYKCAYCNKAFTTTGNLNLHQRIHTGEKPFNCTYCGKAFRLLGDLKKHHVVHTGERAFSCGICGKAYKQHSQLAVHRRTHHNAGGSLALRQATASGSTLTNARRGNHCCVACGDSYDTQAALHIHLVNNHINVI